MQERLSLCCLCRGCCGTILLSTLRVFSPDVMAWVPAPQQADAPPLAPAPCPRAGHAMAYCAASNCVYLFGGAAEGQRLLGDLWRLQMGTFQWDQVGLRLGFYALPAL